MITWLGAAPGFLAAAAVLLVPGVVVALGWRHRGLGLLLLAPPLGLGATAVASVAAPLAGLRWSVLPVLVVAVVLAAPGLLVARRRAGRHHAAPGRPLSERGTGGTPWWVGGGWALAAALTALVFRLGAGRPDAVSQTFDAVFHLNALRYIAATGSSSPLELTGMTGASGFYPSLWHAVASLTVPAAGGSVLAAANLTSLAVVAVVWPLGCVLLVRQVLDPAPVVLGVAAVLSAAFVAFPWFTLSWGVLWPQTLGIALVPAVLACAVSVLGVARRDVLGGPAAGVAALVLVSVGCADAHPGALISAVVLACVLALWVAARRAWQWSRAGRAGWGIGQLVVTAGAVVLVVLALYLTPGVRNTTTHWRATTTVLGAIGRDLVGGPAGTAPARLVSVLVLVGALVCLRRGLGWVVLGHLVTIGLDSVAAGTDAPIAQLLTGFWYGDRYRLAAVVPVTGVVLAVVGVVTVATLLGRVAARFSRSGLRVEDRRRWWPAPAPVAAVVLVVGVLSQGFGLGAHANFLAVRYLFAEDDARNSLVSPAEQAFMARLPTLVPAGAVIAGDPWDGSSLAWAIGDRDVLYRHFNVRLTPDQAYLADHLRDAATDPLVCAALQRTGVQFVLSMGALFSPPLLYPGGYPGTQGIAGQPGFALVDATPAASLYRISACG